ncbi:MAG: type II toxin-antitoxin system VapC family toxin [Candidatus Helarchaeota archaeon]
MAIFLDTGFYMGLVDPNDKHYNRSLELLKELQTGKYGQIYTSTFVMAESATLIGVRTKKHPKAMKTIQNYFSGSDKIAIILRFNEEHEKDTWETFHKINKTIKPKIVSFVDCANIVLCKHYSIEHILAYDEHFDGWVTRIF